MDPMFRDDVEELLGEESGLFLEMLEEDGLMTCEEVLVRPKEQLMAWYGLGDELVEGLLVGLSERREERKKGEKRERAVEWVGPPPRKVVKKAVKKKALKEKKKRVEKKEVIHTHWVQEEMDEVVAFKKKHPNASGGSIVWWKRMQEENPDLLPHRTAAMIRDAWLRYKKNPKKKWPNRGEENAPTFKWGKREDKMLRAVVTRYPTLRSKGFIPTGHQYWENYRLADPLFLPGRTSDAMARRWKWLLMKAKKIAIAERAKENRHVFPEIPKIKHKAHVAFSAGEDDRMQMVAN